MSIEEETRVPPERARWRLPAAELGFETTESLSPQRHILGQDDAVEALRFGLENRLKGNNVFVRGLSGFGRTSLIHQVIEETAVTRADTPDRLYVHNFDAPDQPRLLAVPAGRGKEFRDVMDEFAEFVKTELPAYLASDLVKSRQKQLVSSTQDRIQEIGQPFEQELSEAGLALVPMQVGQSMVPAILPVIEGRPVQFEELQKLRTEGKISEPDYKALLDKITGFEQKFADMREGVESAQVAHQESLQKLVVGEAEHFVQARINNIKKRFNLPAVEAFLASVKDDLIHHRLISEQAPGDFGRAYRVNLVSHHDDHGKAPVVSVTTPNLSQLVGSMDREVSPNGMLVRSDHLMIKPGAILEADGGYLILEAQDVLAEPGAWAALLRTLKTGVLEIASAEAMAPWSQPQLRPEPIPIDVKVVLVGDPEIYYALDVYESRFSSLFKVLADFGDTISRDEGGYRTYANVVARLVERDGLNHFEAGAVAQLIEHGARICAQRGRLTSRFGRIADIAREASFIAHKAARTHVTGEDVQDSVARSRKRADLPARRFRRLLAERTMRVEVEGQSVGQVNGLAVTSSGPLTYGFPSRITTSIGPGSAGAINIERESDLSGAVHTKGFLILGGLLRYLLRLDHPMAFSASIAFEQSYGGVDGDSASGAEFCCLVSALTELPMRQDLAMTGAVDQRGNILPIGAVTEKIEGFFDACQAVNFTGTQGVVIPESNAHELMLRDDVVDAIRDNRFSVHAISSIDQALALFLGRAAGSLHDHTYEAGSVLAMAQDRARHFWEVARSASNSK